MFKVNSQMELPDLNDVTAFATVTLLLFVIITGRYFLVAGLFYLMFHKWFKTKWFTRKINKKNYNSGQFKNEVMWSMITGMIFSIVGTLTLLLWQKGDTYKEKTDSTKLKVDDDKMKLKKK